MFEIKCPKCEVSIKNLAGDYIRWRSDRRECPHCRTSLEVRNPIVCFGICGVIFGFVIGGLHCLDFGNEWIRLAMAVLICWAIMPVIVRIVGQWRVSAGQQEREAGVQRSSKVLPVSLLALGIVFAITYCCIYIACWAFAK